MFLYILMIYFQNVLKELEQKKPQLDDIIKTAENIRGDNTPINNKPGTTFSKPGTAAAAATAGAEPGGIGGGGNAFYCLYIGKQDIK